MSKSEQLLEFLSKEIENSLRDVLKGSKPDSLYQPGQYTLDLNAKRIRPLMLMLASGAVNGDVNRSLPAALAVEMLHNFTLIHDDIMDNAETRRGKPSVFIKWNTSTAILSGDVVFAASYKKLLELSVEDSMKVEIMEEFNKAVITVCEGQAYDMEFEERDDVSLQEYEDMIFAKTGALLQSSLIIGGMIGKADSERIQILSQFGRSLGIAFQMQDDILDAFGASEKVGKIKGGDILAGKKTFLSIRLLELLRVQSNTEIVNEVLEPENSLDYVNKISQYMVKYGVLTETEKSVDLMYSACFDLLSKLPQNEYTEALYLITNKLKNRDH